MKLKNALLPLSALVLAACISQPDYRASDADLPVVAEVDLDRYVGRWHEIARYPNSFERGCVTAMADYAQLPDGRISVINSCTKEDGRMDVAEGKARVVEGSNGAKLKVKFAPSWVPFAEGDYWVLHLEADYSAVLVGAPSGKYLWILARDPAPPQATIDRILRKAEGLGFETAPLIYAGNPA
ncbi:MAG: lipocalin [Alphaproteobacteria bacterium HGW-Alphaproteobacteria-18]|nr:MAG: lipocalin [Alphaproteobacteria bacterium HGW-Alphaproteobacteria-18]